MFLLEFPQNILGYTAFKMLTKIKQRPYYRYRDAYVVHVQGHWGAISLSRFIFADDTYYQSNMIKHEYGHTIQSKLLLIFYIPLVGIPSLLWNHLFKRYRSRHKVSYYSFYTESWANRLGGYRIKNENH